MEKALEDLQKQYGFIIKKLQEAIMSEKYVCDDRTVIEELQMIRNMSDEEFEQYAEEQKQRKEN